MATAVSNSGSEARRLTANLVMPPEFLRPAMEKSQAVGNLVYLERLGMPTT